MKKSSRKNLESIYKKIPIQIKKMRETTGGANSKYPHFPKVEIDVLLITEGNEGTKFLQEFISKRFSSCNLDRQKKEISGIFEQQKECFRNWNFGKICWRQKPFALRQMSPIGFCLERGYVMTYLCVGLPPFIVGY